MASRKLLLILLASYLVNLITTVATSQPDDDSLRLLFSDSHVCLRQLDAYASDQLDCIPLLQVGDNEKLQPFPLNFAKLIQTHSNFVDIRCSSTMSDNFSCLPVCSNLKQDSDLYDQCITIQQNLLKIIRKLQKQPEHSQVEDQLNALRRMSAQLALLNVDTTNSPHLRSNRQLEASITQPDNTPDSNNKQDPSKDKSSESGGNSSMFVTLIVIAAIIGCCFCVVQTIRHRNNNSAAMSFEGLKANIEVDKQLIKPGMMMGIGSAGYTTQMKQQLQLSSIPVSAQHDISVQGNGLIDAGISGLNTPSATSNGMQSTNNKEKEENNTIPSRSNARKFSKRVASQIASGIPSNSLTGQDVAQIQPHASIVDSHSKDHDTSVANNFFSIDGEEDEKNEKIINSVQLGVAGYQSDDTTYSNVFNLEGEEEESSTQRKKAKKKQKSKHHTFFDDKNEGE